MPLLSASLDVFLFTSLAILLPSVYAMRKSPANPALRPPLRTPLTLLVLVHTIYTLYLLLVQYPPNLFLRLDIPLTLASDRIRAVLRERAGLDAAAPIPPHLDMLLTRLASFDMRTIYVRFGQSTLLDCAYCHTFSDYALYSAPRPLLEYLRTAFVAGVLTIRGSHRGRWRPYAVAVLALAAAAEAYWLCTVEVRIPRDGRRVVFWHDTLWTLRHVLFLLLPILLHLLPGTPPPPGAALLAALPAGAKTLESALAHTHLLRLTHGAAARSPDLRARAAQWWARDRAEGARLRADADVQRVAERVGLDFREGKVEGEGTFKAEVRKSLDTLKHGYWPSGQ